MSLITYLKRNNTKTSFKRYFESSVHLFDRRKNMIKLQDLQDDEAVSIIQRLNIVLDNVLRCHMTINNAYQGPFDILETKNAYNVIDSRKSIVAKMQNEQVAKAYVEYLNSVFYE